MRRLAAMVTVALLAGCATESVTPTPFHSRTPPGGEDCDVTVAFGSYASGIDRNLADKIDNWLARHQNLVAEVKKTPWGREGEYTLCVTTTSPAAIDPVFNGLRGKLPRYSKKAPIGLTTRSGKHFELRESTVRGAGYEGGHDARARGNGGIRSPSSPPN